MYYYNDGQNIVGPFSIYNIKKLKGSGLLSDETLIRSSDSSYWLTFSELVSEIEQDNIQGATSDKSDLNQSRLTSGKSYSHPIYLPHSDQYSGPGDISRSEGGNGNYFQEDNANTHLDFNSDPAYKYMPNTSSKPSQVDHPSTRSITDPDDPAYKYMPKDKKKPSQVDHPSTRSITDPDDPAYKYMPKDKKKPSQVDHPSTRSITDPDDPAYKHMPKSKLGNSETQSESFQSSVGISHYFSFKGTASRSEFWVVMVISIIVLSINNLLREALVISGLGIIPFAFFIVFAWLIISTSARRCREAGMNPYLSSLMAVPLVFLVATFVFGIVKPKEE